jgi:hypothetical protein
VISFADGRTEGVPIGSYLASYSPEGDNGQGVAHWTWDPAEAMTFATAAAPPATPGREAQPPAAGMASA